MLFSYLFCPEKETREREGYLFEGKISLELQIPLIDQKYLCLFGLCHQHNCVIAL